MLTKFILDYELINLTGFISMLLFFATLTPSLIGVFAPKLRGQNWSRFLLKYRRQIGVSAWVFGVIHGSMVVYVRNLNFLNPATALRYAQGIALITIFTLLAITSNDWSVKFMKKNWKRLHRLTYLTLFLLPWHIVDKVTDYFQSAPTIYTIIGLPVLIIFIILSLERLRIFVQKKLDSIKN
jgi:sulfoxide reductase heme-binding subunit YedZ